MTWLKEGAASALSDSSVTGASGHQAAQWPLAMIAVTGPWASVWRTRPTTAAPTMPVRCRRLPLLLLNTPLVLPCASSAATVIGSASGPGAWPLDPTDSPFRNGQTLSLLPSG